MKVRELQFGQYFQYGDVIARKIGDMIVFLNGTSLDSCSNLVKHWENVDVTPIDFQTVVALLVKECMGNNQIVEDPNPDAKVDATTLKPGQFFISNDTIGLVYTNLLCCYLTEGSGCWDYIADTEFNAEFNGVIPISMHQAVLYLAKQLFGTQPQPKRKNHPVYSLEEDDDDVLFDDWFEFDDDDIWF